VFEQIQKGGRNLLVSGSKGKAKNLDWTTASKSHGFYTT